MKKFIALLLTLIYVLALVGCKKEEKDNILYCGLNAEIVEIDSTNKIVYVADLDADEVFGASCAIDCQKLIQNQKIIYVDYNTYDVSNIQFADLVVGDEIIINAYESQLNCVADAIITVEQIQLDTQRIDIE